MKTKHIIWLTIIIIAISIAIGYEKPKNNEPIKIGVLLSLTGNFSTFGEDVKNGLELAKAELAEEGTIVEFVYEDTGSDAKKAVPAARKLIDIDKVPIIISGPGSSVNLAVAPLMEESKTVFIAISSTPKLNTAGEYIFKLQPDIDAEIKTMIPFLIEQSVKNIAVIYDSSSDTQVFGKDFLATEFKAAGGNIVAAEGFDGKSSNDYRSQLTKLRSAKPEAYYVLANDKGAGAVIRQAREQGIKEPFYSWSALVGDEFFRQVGIDEENVIITDQLFSCEGTKEMRAYCVEFKQKFGTTPLKYSAHAYDTINILVKTIEDETKDPKAAAMKALTSNTYAERATGILSFDENGNIFTDIFEIRTAKNGAFVKLP